MFPVIALLFIGSIFIHTGCNKNDDGLVTDIDGNIYHTIAIGNQVWMVENLSVTRYRNGDSISAVMDNWEWSDMSVGAWCDMQNEASNAGKYGHLYNWYAVQDERGLCPQGWHIPGDAEWNILIDFLGGEEEAGGKLKSTDTLLWKPPNTGASDLVGFSGLPGGARWQGGLFLYFGYYGLWWTATEENDEFAYYHNLVFDNPGCFRNHYTKSNGCSVRCIRDY